MQILFYNKALNVSCTLLNTVLKVKNRMVFWIDKSCVCMQNVMSIDPSDRVGNWDLDCCPASWEKIVPRHHQTRKGTTFKVQFLPNAYHFCAIIKLKNHQLNHFKSGTVSIMIENYKNCIDFFAQLYADKSEKWDKMHNFLEKYNVPKTAPNKIVSLKRSSFYRRNRKNVVRALSLINVILK